MIYKVTMRKMYQLGLAVVLQITAIPDDFILKKCVFFKIRPNIIFSLFTFKIYEYIKNFCLITAFEIIVM